MYFECNLPHVSEIPTFYEVGMHEKLAEDCDAIHARHKKLEAALEMSGIPAPAFHAQAKKLFAANPEHFDKMTAGEIADWVDLGWDYSVPPERLEWPNAVVLFDTAFVTVDEWETIRRLGIGGSDSSIVRELNPWRTQRDLYYDKIGRLAEKADPVNYALERGHFLEEKVIAAYCKETMAMVIPESRMFRSRSHPHCTANIDAVIRNIDGTVSVFEAKTTVECASSWLHWSEGKVPPYYMTQMRQYPAVLDDDRVVSTIIGCMFVDDYIVNGTYLGSAANSEKNEYRTLERNRDAEQELLDDEELFWENHIAKRVEPELSLNPDLDHASLERYSVMGDPEEPAVTFSDSMKVHVREYLEHKKKADELKSAAAAEEDQMKNISNMLLLEMDGAEKGSMKLDDTTVVEVRNYYRKKNSIDIDVLKKDFPEALEATITINATKLKAEFSSAYKAAVVAGKADSPTFELKVKAVRAAS